MPPATAQPTGVLTPPPTSTPPPSTSKADPPTFTVLAHGGWGGSDAFWQENRCPPMPVLGAFGAGRLHRYHADGLWDLEGAVAKAPDGALFRSTRVAEPDGKPPEFDALILRLGPHAFLYVDATKLTGYADTAAGARRLVEDFAAKHAKAPPLPPPAGTFSLIKTEGRGISTESVPLGAEIVLAPELLALHYGEEGQAWHRAFTARLREAKRGLAILEGPPGTGKTSYLRHLTGELRESHRFYFIPPATLEVLSDPGFIGFWADQRRRYAERQFVVVLEDADGVLMTRANDNRSQVSAILNLSDGMLADFLRLQIICTINGRAADIDPALLRPGRLLSHRVFERMDVARARRLAGHLGRRLPPGGEEYSLAEVYAGGDHDSAAVLTRPRLGFAA